MSDLTKKERVGQALHLPASSLTRENRGPDESAQ